MVLEKCFTDEFISSRAGNNIDKKKIYEKVLKTHVETRF